MFAYVWLCISMYDFSWSCTTMCHSVLLWMTLYFTVWLCLTLEDSIGHCMTLHDPVWLSITLYDSEWSWMTLFINIDWVWLCFDFLLMFQFLSTVCLTLSENVQLWANFGLVSWSCLGWFRMVQNGSNGLKRLKKSSLFSNYA